MSVKDTSPQSPPAPTSQRLNLALGILNTLRREKNPPLARYCTLLALASFGRPATGHEIAVKLGEETTLSGSIVSAERNEYITTNRGFGPSGVPANLHALTPKGIAEVNRLMNPPTC